MSLPDELLNELLSGYLDGVLSEDERARVEQILESDPVAHARLDELKQLSSHLEMAKRESPELPPGFAEDVVQASIERAQSEQLDPEHPLMLAASDSVRKPNRTDVSTEESWSFGQWATMATALAAGLLVVVFFAIRNSGDPAIGTIPNGIAKIDPKSPDKIDSENTNRPNVTSQEMVANSQTSNGAPSGDIARVEKSQDGSSQSLGSELESGPPVVPADPTGREIASSEMPDAAENTSNPRSVDGGKIVETVAQADVPRFVALMVVELQFTELGQDSNALDDALVSVDILDADEKSLDDALVRTAIKDVSPVAQAESEIGKVLFLEAPVKQLDRLISQLAGDQDAVKSIRFSLVYQAQLLEPLHSVRVADPTKVKHSGKSWSIQGQSDSLFEQWTDQIQNVPFAPVGKGVKVPRSSPGPNPMGNLLILVR